MSTDIDTITTDTGVPEPETLLTLAQTKFYASEQYEIARTALQVLVENESHETNSGYYNGELNFCERHLEFLSKNPNVNLAGYLSNLKLMTRKRR